MVRVYFESNSHAEIAAIFQDDGTYNDCVERLEELADEDRMIVTESEDGFPIDFIEKMPNGFENWHETHFEITSAIVKSVDWSGSRARHVSETEGTGGLYELARDLTNKFEIEYQGKEWGVDDDTQYFDALAVFLKDNLKTVR